MAEATDDPYGLNDPHNVALRERALSNKKFDSDEEREAYIEAWNDRLIDKKIRARAMLEAERAAAEEKSQAEAIASAPPVVGPAYIRRRHWGLIGSFLALVVLPVLLAGFVLVFMAKDQFASTTAFTVRSGETSSATELLGGLSTIVGGGAGGNADVLFEFIQSQEIVARIDSKLDLKGHYSRNWQGDPLFSLWPDATIEDLLWFWKRMVRITYDKGTGLLMVEVRAGTPEYAREIATLVVTESESMINKLNESARRDGMANAQSDLDEALNRLRIARENVAKFRARTQILDPLADIQGRMGVLNNLQQQLAEALVAHDLLAQTADAADPRLRQLQLSIDVIQARIVEERRSFSAQNVTVDNTDYPALLAQYESLQVEQEFAEQTYRAALTAMDAARSNAARQQLYLAAYVQPTLAQRAEYPQRVLLMGLTLFFALMLWSILALVYYSLRDRG
ncbi:sugar transporter [Pseudorhodobacter sp. E13]|uniref:sugar transporter n=1 Tax=Pseudorhodobacter sp. E13 TaxID=2487931 RepID=UPI000F8EF7BF|nr:sugar transporter [Pseudorhodobacter sp. E13]RUS64837.1 sugar transporter [Pseudorhodobacter sp. E13]